MLLKLLMHFVSGWWKYSIIVCHSLLWKSKTNNSLPNSVPLFPILHSETSLCSPEISHSRRINLTEVGKHCKLGLPPPPVSSRLLNFHQDTTAYKVRNFPNIKVDLDIG